MPTPGQVVRDVMLSHQARKEFIPVDERAALAMDGGWTLH